MSPVLRRRWVEDALDAVLVELNWEVDEGDYQAAVMTLQARIEASITAERTDLAEAAECGA